MDRSLLDWVKGGIFSDDAAVIMGDVDDRTPLEIYKEKLSPFDSNNKNYYKEVCDKAEPRVRSLINAQLGMEFIPFTNNMDKYPWARSYVAGKQGDEILVIKFISRAAFDHYKSGGTLLEKHQTMVQHDLMVQNAKTCHFIGYVFDKATKQIDTKYMVMIDVEKNREQLLRIWPVICNFHHCLKNRIPPKMKGIDRIELSEQLKDLIRTPCEYPTAESYSQQIKDRVFSFLGGGL